MDKYNETPRFILKFKSPNGVGINFLKRMGHNLKKSVNNESDYL